MMKKAYMSPFSELVELISEDTYLEISDEETNNAAGDDPTQTTGPDVTIEADPGAVPDVRGWKGTWDEGW